MLATLCLLLPAVVIGSAQTPVRSVAGVWTVTAEQGAPVVTHDGTKWSGAPGFPLALFDPPAPFQSGTARVRFRLMGGSDDYSAGLVFGHAPDSTYYYVRYNTKDGNVALWRMDGPTRSVIKHGEVHEQLEKQAWHELVLVVEGARIRASVNGRLHVEHTLDTPPSGLLGLWTKPDATSAFTGWQVSPARAPQ
jgi:hypothetical protein